jgi:hypothetical protein
VDGGYYKSVNPEATLYRSWRGGFQRKEMLLASRTKKGEPDGSGFPQHKTVAAARRYDIARRDRASQCRWLHRGPRLFRSR